MKKGKKPLRDLTWRENIGFIYNRRGAVKKYIKWIKRVAGRLLKTVKFKNFRLEIRGGTGDYAFTGMLAGWWRGIESFVGNEGIIELKYEPVFSDASCLSLDCNIKGHTFVVYLLRPLFIGLATLPYITSLRLFLQYRKLRKGEHKGGHDV